MMKGLIKQYLELRIQLKLVPFLILYILIVLIYQKTNLIGDEDRYLDYAGNLLNGFYSPPFPDYDLWCGPGYPLLLVPFKLFDLPLVGIRLFNALLLYLSLIINYNTIRGYTSKRNAFIFTTVLALYYPIYELLPIVHTECLAWFLISVVIYFTWINFKQESISILYISATGFAIAYLAMVKVIFGYVILIMLGLSAFLYMWSKFRPFAKKSAIIFSFAIILCIPWLYYTYKITGEHLYWANSGSLSMYTMSSPYENEVGSWESIDSLALNPNHKIFIDSILPLNALQRDKALKEKAIENIKQDPKKYFLNWCANVGRLIFNTPYSNTNQTIKSFFIIIPNMFITVLFVLSLPISLRNLNMYPVALIVMFLFITTYLLGSTLLSTYSRMFYITIPFWVIFLSFFYKKMISISVKKYDKGLL